MLSEMLLLSAVSMVIILPFAILLAHTLRSQLFGVSPADPVVAAGALLSIGLVVAIAALLPARRAASVDPMQALRTE